MSSHKVIFTSLVILFTCVSILYAGTDANERTGLFGKEFHNPTPWLELSGDFRFYSEYQNIHSGFQNKNRSEVTW